MSYKHQAKKHCHKACGGYEIAISKKDLWIKGKCRILEKQSTAGFEEVPQIKYPDKFTVSNRLIQCDQYWCVDFKWKVYGPLACLLDCGYWKSKVYFELMGGGETSFSPETITQDVGKSGHRYKAQITINPYSLKPGIYRVVCCTQFCLKKGHPGPIVGFHDLGLVKIYKDKKEIRRPYANTSLATVQNGEG